MKIILLLAISLAFIYSSCNKRNDEVSDRPLACVYKIKDTAYFNYVRAFLKKDGQQIAGHSGPNPELKCTPLRIDSFYYYESEYRQTCGFAVFGEKTIPLDIKYDTTYFVFNTDTMMNHILNRDPFVEYYQYDYSFIMGCKSLAEDTAKLNEWIRKGELGKYLKRLK
jgi:hypothetical protein